MESIISNSSTPDSARNADRSSVPSRTSSSTTSKSRHKRRTMPTPALSDQLGRLGETDYELGDIHNKLAGQVILPVSELNRLRRELVSKLIVPEEVEPHAPLSPVLPQLLAQIPKASPATADFQLVVLCRTLDQVRAALETSIETIYVDFEDL